MATEADLLRQIGRFRQYGVLDFLDTIDVPAELVLGWISKESGGNYQATPPVLPGQTEPERGFWQIHPSESKDLGLDHPRLSTDPAYSLEAGRRLIEYYANAVARQGYQYGTDVFWHLVKFWHGIGGGNARKLLDDMRQHGVQPSTWDVIATYARQNESRLFSLLKSSPSKWITSVDGVFSQGKALATLAQIARPQVAIPLLLVALALAAWILWPEKRVRAA